VRPQAWDHWDKMRLRPVLQALRSEAGEAMILRDNLFIEQVLPKAVLRTLSVEEMAEYRRPFAEPGEGRRPTLTWPRKSPSRASPPTWLRSRPPTRTGWRRAVCPSCS
jgi:haloalkane dehalogenase